jgi:hypothetical protein
MVTPVAPSFNGAAEWSVGLCRVAMLSRNPFADIALTLLAAAFVASLARHLSVIAANVRVTP